ncbi:unnamed protein product [Prunus brigantina]
MFLRDNSCSLTLYPNSFTIKDLATKRMLFQGLSEDGVYRLPAGTAAPLSSSPSIAFLANKCDILTWHKRLGHPHFSLFRKIVSSNHLPVSDDLSESLICSDCMVGKAHKLPFVSSAHKSTKPLELVHSDVWGPSPTVSALGYKYYVLFLDDYTKYGWFSPCFIFSCFCFFSSYFSYFFFPNFSYFSFLFPIP